MVDGRTITFASHYLNNLETAKVAAKYVAHFKHSKELREHARGSTTT
jgi:nucleoid DNA-binding protein